MGHFGHQRFVFVGGSRPGTLSQEGRDHPPTGRPDHSRRFKCDEVRVPKSRENLILVLIFEPVILLLLLLLMYLQHNRYLGSDSGTFSI